MIVKSGEKWDELVRKALSSGGLVVYPTDTVYGVGGDPYDERALSELGALKGKREGKPYPILASSPERAFSVGRFSTRATRLAKKFWPGRLTIVVPLLDERLRMATQGSDHVGLRVPADPVAIGVASASPSGLVVGTSANRSGAPPPHSLDEVDEDVRAHAMIAIDGGKRDGSPSTVVQVDNDDLKVIRVGDITPELLQNV
ncbi:MAG: L-threonylcarbamoyladenylate synthase [Candidatus Marsarchaeota archaeon]